jgi:DNA primase
VLDQTREIFLMEGETDAISMIDGGAEASTEVSVLALPNAGVVPVSLAEVARGRKVVLFLDNDEAGQKACRKIEALLRPVAVKVATWRAK